MSSENIKAVLAYIIIFTSIGACVYAGINVNDPPPKNQKECSYILYFDTTAHKFKAKYTPAIFNDDSLVNFTDQRGKVWWQKDFASCEQRKDENDVDINDITLKNGIRYKVTDISSGGCKINAIEDSLHNDLINSTDDDESNNN